MATRKTDVKSNKPKKPAPKQGPKRVTTKDSTVRYDHEKIITEICERLCTGETLLDICRDDHMPSANSVHNWMSAGDAVASRISHARKIGFDAIANDALRIANTPVMGVEEVTRKVPLRAGVKCKLGEKPKYVEQTELRVGDMLGHRKLQVETRLKLLAKWDRERYGEFMKSHVSGPEDGPIPVAQTIDASQLSDKALKELMTLRTAMKKQNEQ